MYNWDNSKSKSKSKSNPKFDPNNTKISSSFLNKFNKPPKAHSSKSHQNEDINLYTSSSTTTKTPKTLEDEKMSTLRRACLVEKWMEKRVSEKTISRGEKKPNSRSSSTTLQEEFDLHDSFFSSTSTYTASSSSDDMDYSVFSQPKHKTPATCFAPPRPKPIKTHSIESKFLKENGENCFKNPSMATKFYSNLKNLKQPISPGVRLTSFINSLFTKDGRTSSKNGSRKVTKQRNSEEITPTCSSASSFSRSCLMSKNKKFQDDGIKRTVRFCPVSVIVDHDSQACGYKSLQEESENILVNSNFKRSLSKKYQELKKFNGLEKENDIVGQHQRKLEEVALDLLSGYWDARLNKSHDISSKIKGHNDDDYGVNHGVIYSQHEDDYDNDDDDDDDGFSCSSSDLFELDSLSLIGNELPVYETTKLDNKIM